MTRSNQGQASLRWRIRFAILLAACAPFVAMACGQESAPPAAGDGASSFMPLDGPCRPEGAVRECHVPLGEASGALGCFKGKQECRGAWTTCGGTDITLSAINLGTKPSTLQPLVSPVSDSGVCTLDPCDPYCAAYNEDASVAPDASVPTGYFNMTGIFGGAPGGFAKKSDCGSSSSGCNHVAPGAPYPRKCNGEDHFSIWDSCLADTHCDTSKNGGEGACVANWNTAATTDPRWDEATSRWLPAVCPTVDLTVSAACEVSGVPGFNICNRGNTPAVAAQVGIFLDNGNGEFGSSTFEAGTCPNKAPSCSPAIPGGSLAPGKCLRVTNATCPAWSGGGNPVAYVNPQAAIAECGGLVSGGASTRPGCNNNWADVKNKGDACGTLGSSFGPVSQTFTYQAICAPGHRVHWKTLTYAATVPCSPGACTGANAGKVEFFGTLSTVLGDGGGSTTAETLIADATTTKTVNCTFGVDAGSQPRCPVNLRTWAEGVTPGGSNYSELELRVALTPTPDASASPSVSAWQVAYDCVPNE